MGRTDQYNSMKKIVLYRILIFCVVSYLNQLDFQNLQTAVTC